MFNRQQYNKDYYQAHKKQRTGHKKLLCKRGHLRQGDNLTSRGACKQCQIIWRQNWRDKHPIERSLYAKTYIRNRKLKLVELAGEKCQRCGFNEHPSALDFDHIDPATKLNKRTLSTLPLDKAINELKNVMLLCANCHRIKTWAPEIFNSLV